MSTSELPDIEVEAETELDEDDHLRPEFIRAVLDAVADGNDEEARSLVEPLHPADLADLFELTPGEQRAALARAKARLPSARIEGLTWYWPAGENPASKRHADDGQLRLLAPFDPVVWDRRRFEVFWDWAYRFEAYTPAPQRVRGYYALPMLWQGQVLGWGNLALRDGRLQPQIGFVAGKAPRDAAFKPALDAELARIESFLAPR